MKTYTDDEIVRVLECCGRIKGNDCDNCPLKELQFNECTEKSSVDALDLIKRQQAEIDFLKAENEGVKEACDILNARNKKPMDIAIKEFAERLKEKATSTFYEERKYVDTEDIDELVKEMTEGGDAT